MTPCLRTHLEQDSHLKHLFLNHHAIISSQSGTSSWLICSLKVGAHRFISTIVGLRHDGCGPTEWEAQWQQHGALSWVVPPSPIVMLNPYTIAKIRKQWFSRGMNGMYFSWCSCVNFAWELKRNFHTKKTRMKWNHWLASYLHRGFHGKKFAEIEMTGHIQQAWYSRNMPQSAGGNNPIFGFGTHVALIAMEE